MGRVASCSSWCAGRPRTASLSRNAFEGVLDMLAGRYPSDAFAELVPGSVWDRVDGTLTARRGAQRLAVTSGGTIPDRGLFGVYLAAGSGGGGPGRRVGEFDEEMVYESRVGDVILLGSSSWRIEDIGADRVLVSPAPGQPGKLPFWHGDAPGRPLELGRALGAFARELSALDPPAAGARLAAAGLDEWAQSNLLAYLAEQREATARCPMTARSWSSGFVTNSGIGAWPSIRPSARKCMRPGRWPQRRESGKAPGSTRRCCIPMTG